MKNKEKKASIKGRKIWGKHRQVLGLGAEAMDGEACKVYSEWAMAFWKYLRSDIISLPSSDCVIGLL